MVLMMNKDATAEQIAAMVKRLEGMELRACVVHDAERTLIATPDAPPRETQPLLERGEGVFRVVDGCAAYQLASREIKRTTTVVAAGSLTIGAAAVGIIAGPCSVEGESQLLETARAVKACGATALRGGAFKPRTSPYSFQGLGKVGLELLQAAKEETGLAIVTEVVACEDVELVAEYADVLQVGARNMQNYRLLEALGSTDAAVLLKRGPSATMDEFLLAAEYVLSRGNWKVILCERGIRSFEKHTRYTLPLASIAYLKQRTHLPVIIDPSHGTGHAYMVPDLSTGAIAAGADGLIVEVHPDPPSALSDGPQSLTIEQFEVMMERCRRVAEAVDRGI